MSTPDVSVAKELLRLSRENIVKGCASLDLGMRLRDEAFDALPSGVRLTMDVPANEPFVCQLGDDGEWLSLSVGDAPPRAEWVREQWGRGNFRIVEDAS